MISSEDDNDWDIPESDDESVINNLNNEDKRQKIAQIVPLSNQIICLDDVYQEMLRCIEQLKVHIPILSSYLKALLKKYKWDPNMIINKRFEYESIVDFLENEDLNVSAQQCEEFTTKEGECAICYCQGYLLALSCEHGFDRECWKQSTIQKIKTTGNTNIECLHANCKIIVPEDLLLTLFEANCQNKEVKRNIELIKAHAVEDYVKSSNSITRCNGGSCKNTFIKYGIEFNNAVRCKCSNRFCCDCGEFYHFPLTCEMLRMFRKYDDADKQTKSELEGLRELLKNTKDCPLCGFTIEKISGCDHMTCRKCRHEFCWLCLTTWPKANRSHNCDIRNSKSIKNTVTRQNVWRRFFHRGKIDLDKRKFEIALIKYNNHRVGKHYETLINEAIGKVDVSTSLSVVNVLPELYSTQQDARHLAMSSHAFLFFVEADRDVLPFIALQLNSLENIINLNSGLMNEISTNDNPAIHYNNVKNKTEATLKIMGILEDKFKLCKETQLFKYCKEVKAFDV
uniref:RBR-type E3 ubiquitin transferase n=1 Tax=Rhabditophanes sp. KR3021 TaxID=114890 RepID=A0AC35UDF5_9BILA